MDADKEGFLRSERSLIQTIGRAARNVDGYAILYADKVTGSMQRAMDETERRRAKQVAHNKKHGITPKGIIKKVTDIMEGARIPGAKLKGKGKHRVAETASDYVNSVSANRTPWEQIKILENQMFEAAKNLEFEKAGEIRDAIQTIKKEAM